MLVLTLIPASFSATLLQIPPHNVGWDTIPTADIGSHINGSGNPLTATTELNEPNILDTWGRMEPESEVNQPLQLHECEITINYFSLPYLSLLSFGYAHQLIE